MSAWTVEASELRGIPPGGSGWLLGAMFAEAPGEMPPEAEDSSWEPEEA
ncbi:MAG: hypothetical protein WDZ51_05105 [Pirellulaceae bacterium]